MIELLEKPDSASSSSATDGVYRSLRDGIVTGKIAPGTRLVHRKLAKQMGTSNIPVVSALRQLEGIGLLVNTPGEGAQVRRWDPQDYEETFRIRAALEGVAYRYFAERASNEDFKKLDEHNARFDAACKANALEECIHADRDFHLHIVHASRSQELIRMVENAGLILLTIGNILLPPELLTVGIVGDHKALIKALKSHDPDVAEQEGRKHLMDSPVLVTLRRQLDNDKTLRQIHSNGRPSSARRTEAPRH